MAAVPSLAMYTDSLIIESGIYEWSQLSLAQEVRLASHALQTRLGIIVLR